LISGSQTFLPITDRISLPDETPVPAPIPLRKRTATRQTPILSQSTRIQISKRPGQTIGPRVHQHTGVGDGMSKIVAGVAAVGDIHGSAANTLPACVTPTILCNLRPDSLGFLIAAARPQAGLHPTSLSLSASARVDRWHTSRHQTTNRGLLSTWR
jgi:hypothetical protein